MIRALISLCGALFLLAVDRQVAAFPPPGGATVASPPVRCEQPAGTIAVPAPGSEADILSTMRQWLAEHETISQMDAWWQARTQLPNAPPSAAAPPKEAISELDAWWRERTALEHALARKPVPSVQHRRHRGY